MNSAFLNFTIKAVSEDRRELEGWASLPATDRQGDQVMPEGARFELPLPFLLDHAHDKVVGEVYRAEVSKAGIKFWARIQKIAEPGAAKDLVDYAWSLIKNGLRKVVSVGFRPLEYEALPTGGMRFTAWDWYELSAVGIAAQPGAKITGLKAAGAVNRAPPADRVVRLSPVARAHLNGTLTIKAPPLRPFGDHFVVRKIKRVGTKVVRLPPEEVARLNPPAGPTKQVRLTHRDFARARAKVVKL